MFGYVITFLKLVGKHFAHMVQKLDNWLAQGSDVPTLSVIIHDCQEIIIPCVPFESLGSNVNKYGGFKSRCLQNLQ